MAATRKSWAKSQPSRCASRTGRLLGATFLENFQAEFEVRKEQLRGHRVDLERNRYAVRLKGTPGTKQFLGRLGRAAYINLQFCDQLLERRPCEFPEDLLVRGFERLLHRVITET